jgi:hypothetical protein
VIDLSRLKGIRVDQKSQTVRVDGGCLWGDVDHATHPFGLAVPSGFLSTTGVGGLTLGGGIGYLSRKYGLTIDNLLGVDVVLADGRLVTASATENADLFWAVRGGGGNFGVVTSFLFRGNPVGTVYGGPIFWPLDKGAEVLRFWRNLILKAPEDINGWFGFATVPPVPMFPADHHMKKVCMVTWCYTGDLGKAEEAFKPIRQFSPPLMDKQQAPHAMGQGLLARASSFLGGRRLHQHDDGRGRGQREGCVPRQLRAPRPGEAEIRPGQPVPGQPEHQARVGGHQKRENTHVEPQVELGTWRGPDESPRECHHHGLRAASPNACYGRAAAMRLTASGSSRSFSHAKLNRANGLG